MKILICPIEEIKISLSDIKYIIISVSSYGTRNKERYNLVSFTDGEKDENLQKHATVRAHVPPNLLRVGLKMLNVVQNVIQRGKIAAQITNNIF